MLSPQAMTESMEVAKAIVEAADKANRSIICCWMGEEQVSAARKFLEESGIPAFRRPGGRIRVDGRRASGW
jgi:acetyltransferase